MGAGGNDDIDLSSSEEKIWNGSDEESFYSLDHPGYSLESDPNSFVGGWHAHRAVWEGEDNSSTGGSRWTDRRRLSQEALNRGDSTAGGGRF